MIKKPETINTIKINFFVSFFLKLLGMRSMQCSSLLFEKLNQCRHCPGTIIYKTPSIFSSWGGDVVKQKTPKVFLLLLMFSGHTEFSKEDKMGAKKVSCYTSTCCLAKSCFGDGTFFSSPLLQLLIFTTLPTHIQLFMQLSLYVHAVIFS